MSVIKLLAPASAHHIRTLYVMANSLVPVSTPVMMKNNINPLRFMPSQFAQQALRFTAPCLSCMYV